jgi:hypothetical protein
MTRSTVKNIKNTFGDLRATLHTQASCDAWDALCDALTSWPDAHERDDVILPYVHALLATWPAHLRVAPEPWIDAALIGQTVPMLSLVTTIRLSARDDRPIEPHHLTNLLHHQPLTSLTTLHLAHALLDHTHLDVLLTSPHCAQLTRLNLAHNLLNDDAARSLASAPLHALEHLDLSRNRLSRSSTIKLLLTSPHLPTHLQIVT